MRGAVPGLVSPHPIGRELPAVYLEDDFAQRFTAGLDEVLAPVLLTLDCLDAYFDLDLAPADFVDWLAGWVAAPADAYGQPGADHEPDAGHGSDTGHAADAGHEPGAGRVSGARREAIRHAVEVHRWRGTARGIELALRVATGAQVEVTDSGGVTCSATPTQGPPPGGVPEVRVRITGAVDEALVREVLASAVPVHVRVTLEVQP
ncbi:phage tail protein [Micromonospora haikouensis]|uniref:phage tail protein n=1 Tax=Micromonospora haikouensis TaxID=686309 RepID=UPI0037A1AB8B